jgi:hypothetical protein
MGSLIGAGGTLAPALPLARGAAIATSPASPRVSPGSARTLCLHNEGQRANVDPAGPAEPGSGPALPVRHGDARGLHVSLQTETRGLVID